MWFITQCFGVGFRGSHRAGDEVNNHYKNLHALLATLPDPSVDTGPVAIPVAEAREMGLIPKADTTLLQAFSASEMKLYKHATKYKWTVEELADTIKLIKSADFNVEDINADLHYMLVPPRSIGFDERLFPFS